MFNKQNLLKEKSEIKKPVRQLYSLIGRVIGETIKSRIANANDLGERMADDTIETINELRRELKNDRNFTKLIKQINEIFEFHGEARGVKLLAWIQEAFELLNQSSTHISEIFDERSEPEFSKWANDLLDSLMQSGFGYDDLKEIFENEFSANLVLTAHPTAGIDPDYAFHIKKMVDEVRKIADKAGRDLDVDINEFIESNPGLSKEIIEEVEEAVLSMTQSLPYNQNKIHPFDESKRFLSNITNAWEILPRLLFALEDALARKFSSSSSINLNQNAFRIHSWVARDIDGNPTVSKHEHLRSLINERLFFVRKYLDDIYKLRQDLSGNFAKKAVQKTFFVDHEFEKYFLDLCKRHGLDPNSDGCSQAYRVIFDYEIVRAFEDYERKLDQRFINLMDFNISEEELISIDLDIYEKLIYPLKLIRANKLANNENKADRYKYTKAIDLLIFKANIFGITGSYGHTRQDKKVLNKLVKIWFGEKANTEKTLTDFILGDAIHKKSLNDIKKTIDNLVLPPGENPKTFVKLQKNLLQTCEILDCIKHGGIKRLIISLSSDFDDMLGALALMKQLGYFIPDGGSIAPQSKVEIVPLTEKISDLRNSYKYTVKALLNPALRRYLVAQGGRLVKMRGPSDSGKQNGFIASQWEMFKSKHFDLIVVDIFNAYLEKHIYDDYDNYDLWQKVLANKKDSIEKQIIEEVFNEFEKNNLADNLIKEKSLWIRSEVEKLRLVHFDGWGEPVERGSGLDFENTVSSAQPSFSNADYERTLQGGGAYGLYFLERTNIAFKDIIKGLLDVGTRKHDLEKSFQQGDINIRLLDLDFCQTMDSLIAKLRQSLREELFGLSIDSDETVVDEKNLREYFSHVVKSPLIFLDLFNIASRPTSRSGAMLAEILEESEYNNNINNLALKLSSEEIINILNDIRAIPYAAMFSLLGGNHVSFYGFSKVFEDRKLLSTLKKIYQSRDDNQATRLIKHMFDSLEQGLIMSDLDCYKSAYQVIEYATNLDYLIDKDTFINKIDKENQAARNFIAHIKSYKVKNKNKVLMEELLQNNPEKRSLLNARRNDAAVPRLGLGLVIAKILAYAKNQEKPINPLKEKNLSEGLIDLLRKSFAACASNYGTGCIDG